MTRASEREALREELREWGEIQRSQAARRDALILTCLNSGLFKKEEIHVLTGLGRTTIDRIEKSGKQPQAD